LPKKLLVVDVASLGWDLVNREWPESGSLRFRKLEPVFPAVTCTAQASFRTAAPPRDHGMVSNGIFFRDLRKPMFWEQAATLVEGPRIWQRFRERGGRVGMVCWQQSLGEDLDLVLSPKPVHKHSGGMIQDCYTQPHDLYRELTEALGRRFNLMHYWGPLASRRSSDWIVDAVIRLMEWPHLAPDLLLCYLPHLDYDLQKYGPGTKPSKRASTVMVEYLERLSGTAREAGYACLIFGDYSIKPATQGAVFPNRLLRDAGLFRTRAVRERAYPDFFASEAAAVVDHEIAHVITAGPKATEQAKALFLTVDGIGEVLDAEGKRACRLDHPRSGELVLVADTGWWFAYPWWHHRREAPDYATHVDIHNKPGYDPCELFFGWPPLSVSMNTHRVQGTHGRIGPGRQAAWSTTCDFEEEPHNLIELAKAVEGWLESDR